MGKNVTKIFSEHCDILLQDIRSASVNGKREAIKRLIETMASVINLYAAIYEMPFKEADRFLFETAYPGAKMLFEAFLPSSSSVHNEFTKAMTEPLKKLETAKEDSTEQQTAANIACEITTIYAEIFSMSYDEAAKAFRKETVNAH